MFFKKKKEIILSYCTGAFFQKLSFKEIRKKSSLWQLPLLTIDSENNNCGDVVYLLIKKDNLLWEFFFSVEQSCLITISITSMICFYLNKKNTKTIKKILKNCEATLNNKKQGNLNQCPDFWVFQDFSSSFPSRWNCANFVLKKLIETFDLAE